MMRTSTLRQGLERDGQNKSNSHPFKRWLETGLNLQKGILLNSTIGVVCVFLTFPSLWRVEEDDFSPTSSHVRGILREAFIEKEECMPQGEYNILPLPYSPPPH